MGDKGGGYGERGGGWNMRGEKTGEEKKKTVVRMDCMEEKSIFNLKKRRREENLPQCHWGRTISSTKLMLNTSKMMYS